MHAYNRGIWSYAYANHLFNVSVTKHDKISQSLGTETSIIAFQFSHLPVPNISTFKKRNSNVV